MAKHTKSIDNKIISRIYGKKIPFSQQGGLGRVHQLFGDELNTVIEELNEALAA